MRETEYQLRSVMGTCDGMYAPNGDAVIDEAFTLPRPKEGGLLALLVILVPKPVTVSRPVAMRPTLRIWNRVPHEKKNLNSERGTGAFQS